MEFDKVIKKRKSTRDFNKKSVSFKDVLEAISSTIEGPFSGNHNNLNFLIIENPETIKKISKHCQQTWIQNSKLLIIICSDERHLEETYGERGRVYSRQQAGAAISTLLLKLTELSIDSCWVGSYADDLLKEILKIPQHIQIEAIIPTGHETKISVKPKKKKLSSVLYWETWKNYKRPTIFEEKVDKLSLRRI